LEPFGKRRGACTRQGAQLSAWQNLGQSILSQAGYRRRPPIHERHALRSL
jgi:hypothetical protein